MARRSAIVEKTRELEIAPSSPRDFALGDGAPFPASDILRSGLEDRARYTLYCLDEVGGTALFVETPPDCRLEDAPFFYAAQYEHARAVIHVSKEEFFELARRATDPGPRLGWVQSVGRSGTTLASRAFATCEGVYSLSEPDVLLQVLALGPGGPKPESPWKCADEESLDALLDACVRLLCAEATRSGKYHRLVIKPRSQFCEAFAPILRLYPASETLFLGRAPLPWLKSVFSAFLRDLDCDDPKLVGSFEKSLGSYIPLIQSRIRPDRPQAMGALWALHYVSALREFETAKRAGLSAYSLDFVDLKADPRRHFETVFARWGLDWDRAALTRVLERDSQAGSGLAREGRGRAEYVAPAHQIEAGEAVFREFGLV